MTVSVVDEGAHGAVASTTSTISVLSRSAHERGSAQSDRPAGNRKRAASFESWLNRTLHKDGSPEREARRAGRRARRKAFFRKLFRKSPEGDDDDDEDEEDEAETKQRPSIRRSMSLDVLASKSPPDESSAYRLDDTYYASIASIVDQYKMDRASEKGEYDASDLDSNTDMSEISVFDLEEESDDDFYDDDDCGDDDANGMAPIPETDVISARESSGREMPAYVSPPVRVPIEYTLQDRRGGTVVAGRHVLFTSAAFKRKQRQYLYTMKSVPEDAQFIVPQIREDTDSEDDELVTDGVFALQSEWI